MTNREVGTFLRHRSLHGQMKMPHVTNNELLRRTLPNSMARAVSDCVPKPLGSHSFVVEVVIIAITSKIVRSFWKRAKDVLPVSLALRSQNATKKHWQAEIDTEFRVCVIDRESGMQAKLFESKAECQLTAGRWDLGFFVAFEKSGPLTQFSDGTDADTIPVPATNVMLLDAYREDPDRADCLVLSVFPCWVNCEAVADRETEDTLPILECEEKDLLTFLEKGPSHK